MNIINFGSCNIDIVYSLDHIVKPGETQTTHRQETFPGGKGLNQSIALARAGAKVFHAGCIGKDGKMLADILKESGADISYIKTVPERNGHAIIQVSKDGENSIFLYPGSNEAITKEFVDSVLKNFKAGDIVLLQNEISNIDYIISEAFKKQMCIILNPSPYNEKIKEIDFNMLSYIILNEIEAMEITGMTNAAEAINFFKKEYPLLKVVLTLGKNGCIYTDSKQKISSPAFSVKAVDTTAAGDTFTGYFVSSVADGAQIEDALELASAAAAIAITKNGAAPSIPERKEVLSTLKKLKHT